MEGTIIGQYRIVQKIGAGGMGVVYLAEHTLVGRRAAIKVLLPEFSVRRAIVTRFFNEARAMTSIPDPGIVQMYDFGFHSEGSAYIVMELLEGETLERRVKRLKRMKLVDAVRVTRQLAGSLASAHAAGIFHRDLKPENVFIVRDPEALGGERPKVLDFGVAKLSGDVDQAQTLAGTMMGTPAYMSPEQCRGAGEVDARSDIYSLGCVLARLVTGQLPFVRRGVGEVISAHLNDAPARPSDLAPDLPDELDDIVLKCLAKSPDDRFQSMDELQAACDALLVRLSQGDAPGAISTPGSSLRIASRSARVHGDSAQIDVAISNPTTLSSAAGVTTPSVPRRPPRRIGVWLGFGGALAVGGIAAAIALTGGNELVLPASPATAAPPPVSGAVIEVDAGTAIDAADADAAAAPSDDTPGSGAAPAAKSRSTFKPRRPAPERTDELYDDR